MYTIEEIQLDVTSHCNAKCPGCARNEGSGKTVSWLNLHHLDLTFWNNFLTDIKNKFQIKRIRFNGNYGDAIMHPDLIDVIKIFRTHYPKSVIQIPTNGSARSSDWWKELASVLDSSEYYSEVQFAIDGLEDTHSIWRQNTDFNKIIKNIKTFIEAGGLAQIVTTLFDHNQHQVDEIVNMAYSLGCTSIFLRPSYHNETEVKTDKNFVIYAKETREMMEKADWKYNKMYDKPLWFDNNSSVKANQKIHNQIVKNKSKCPWIHDSLIQMDCWGNVWPCCHIAETVTRNKFPNIDKSITRINSLYKQSLDSIMADSWFTKTLPESLDSNPWDICQKRCGIV